MTYKEAIKKFEPIVNNEAYADYFKDACVLATKALEKQIPAEVTEFAEFSHDGSSFYKLDFLCPGCGHAVYGQPYKPNFCKECGQALDWSE